MKSFFSFNEDATAAKAEAQSRERRAQEYTQQMKKKTFSKSQETIRNFLKQKKKAKKFREQQAAQRELSAKKAQETSQSLSKAAKSAHRITKSAVSKLRELARKKSNSSHQ